MKLNPETNGKGRDAAGGASPSRSPSSLSRARSQLSQAVGGVLSGSLGGTWRISFSSGGSANPERLRDVVQRDRALFAANPRPRRELYQVQDAPKPAEEEAAKPPREVDPDAALSVDADLEAPPSTVVAEAPQASAAETSVAEPEKRVGARKEARPKREPIRTRTMARLLAAQGHKSRALSIYDELIAADASDATLVAEAASLRTPDA